MVPEYPVGHRDGDGNHLRASDRLANSPACRSSRSSRRIQKQFWQVYADDKNNGLVGAYVSTTARGTSIPPKTNVFFNLNSNTLQFVLSSAVTATTTPIPVTFGGYLPQLLKSVKRHG